jgi:hypothetical protein
MNRLLRLLYRLRRLLLHRLLHGLLLNRLWRSRLLIQAVAAAGAPALPQAAALAGAAVQKHTAVDTGAAADEVLHAPHGLRRAQY